MPYLSSYLDAIEGNFRHGANFAAFGAPIQPVNANIYGNLFNPLALNIQLLQFQQLKERIGELQKQGSPHLLKHLIHYYSNHMQDQFS